MQDRPAKQRHSACFLDQRTLSQARGSRQVCQGAGKSWYKTYFTQNLRALRSRRRRRAPPGQALYGRRQSTPSVSIALQTTPGGDGVSPTAGFSSRCELLPQRAFLPLGTPLPVQPRWAPWELRQAGRVSLRSGPAQLQLDVLPAGARLASSTLLVIGYGRFLRLLLQIEPLGRRFRRPHPPHPRRLRCAARWDGPDPAALESAHRQTARARRQSGLPPEPHWPSFVDGVEVLRPGAQELHGPPPGELLPGRRGTAPRGRRAPTTLRSLRLGPSPLTCWVPVGGPPGLRPA